MTAYGRELHERNHNSQHDLVLIRDLLNIKASHGVQDMAWGSTFPNIDELLHIEWILHRLNELGMIKRRFKCRVVGDSGNPHLYVTITGSRGLESEWRICDELQNLSKMKFYLCTRFLRFSTIDLPNTEAELADIADRIYDLNDFAPIQIAMDPCDDGRGKLTPEDRKTIDYENWRLTGLFAMQLTEISHIRQDLFRFNRQIEWEPGLDLLARYLESIRHILLSHEMLLAESEKSIDPTLVKLMNNNQKAARVYLRSDLTDLASGLTSVVGSTLVRVRGLIRCLTDNGWRVHTADPADVQLLYQFEISGMPWDGSAHRSAECFEKIEKLLDALRRMKKFKLGLSINDRHRSVSIPSRGTGALVVPNSGKFDARHLQVLKLFQPDKCETVKALAAGIDKSSATCTKYLKDLLGMGLVAHPKRYGWTITLKGVDLRQRETPDHL